MPCLGGTCLLISFLFSGSAQFSIHQYRQTAVPEGSTASLGCFVEGEQIRGTEVQWFKQLPDSAPSYILRHGNDSSAHWASPSWGRYHSPQNSSNTPILQIRNVSLQDSAFYWCLLTKQPFHYVWGDGIYLSVYGGDNVQEPSVSVMSSQEPPGSTILHVACSVTGFFPPVIEVTWKLNDKVLPADIVSAHVQSEEDNTFSMISILSLSSDLRKELSSVSCEVYHDASGTRITQYLNDCH